MPCVYFSPADRWVGPALLFVLISVTAGKHCWRSWCTWGVICKQEALLQAGRCQGTRAAPGMPVRSGQLGSSAVESQAGVSGAAGCDDQPSGLREIWGIPTAAGHSWHAGESWCGASHVGDDAELPRGPHRQGSEMDNLSSHRRSGYGCKGFAAQPLLCGFFQPQGVFQPCKGGEGKLNPCLGPCFLLPRCRGPLAKP